MRIYKDEKLSKEEIYNNVINYLENSKCLGVFIKNKYYLIEEEKYKLELKNIIWEIK